MKNIHLLFCVTLLTFFTSTAKAGGLEIGDRFYNKGYLLWGGQIMTLTRDQLAQRVHLYLAQPADSRIMILQNTQSGTVSIFTRLNNGTWKIVADNKTGLLPTITQTSTNKYNIYWGDVYDRTFTFNY